MTACCPTREALEAQHQAIDWLFATLAELKAGFYPSQSPAWPLMMKGHEVMKTPCPCQRLAQLEAVANAAKLKCVPQCYADGKSCQYCRELDSALTALNQEPR